MHPLPQARPLALALALALPVAAYADDAPPSTLDRVVVTAAGFEQKIEDAPASITILQGEDLRRKSFRDLGDALRDVEGVAVNGSANETDISLRGMPPDYTLILVDGKRQSARESRVNGNRGYEQSFIPPVEAIERIEIVRGSMSSLYGSDAIGGVINIITRKVAREWGGALTLDYTAQQHSEQGNARQAQFFLNGPLVDDRLGFQLWGRDLDRQADDDVANGGFTRARHRNLTARLAYTPTTYQEILLEAGATRLKNGEGLAGNWSERQQDNDRDHASLSWKGQWDWGTSEVVLASETSSREGLATPDQTDVYGRRPEVDNNVVDAKFVVPLGAHMLTTGAQWNQGKVHDWNQGLNDRVQYTFAVVQKALFAEDEWSLTEDLALTAGLRLDDHEQYGRHVNPRLYAVWHATPSWTFKGGVSRGFKAPEIRAVVPGYAYLRRNRWVMLGNPDLKPETSTTWEAAALWSNRAGASAGITVFQNDFEDKLSTVTTTELWNGYIIMERVNIDSARIRGVELNGRLELGAVALKGNYAFTDAEQRSGAAKGAALTLTPRHTAHLGADWTVSERLRLWAAANYYGEEYGTTASAEPAPGYTTADLGASFEFNDAWTFNAAFHNLGDKRLDEATYGTVNYGRNLWVSANWRF
ncbi:TonB-dependent receptor [Luteimonas sp. XNQY3]|nr:TonB-dependent receptor [Luteimonas sp. XNQY3]MCD9005067.1 TonB-dependent receptor [Luteimonas sp. XNQY3]